MLASLSPANTTAKQGLVSSFIIFSFNSLIFIFFLEVNNTKYARILFVVGGENKNYKENLLLAEKLKENGVPAVLPLSFDNRYFIKYNKQELL